MDSSTEVCYRRGVRSIAKILSPMAISNVACPYETSFISKNAGKYPDNCMLPRTIVAIQLTTSAISEIFF